MTVSALTQALGREFHSGSVLTKNECCIACLLACIAVLLAECYSSWAAS